jgi:hypothetical protein
MHRDQRAMHRDRRPMHLVMHLRPGGWGGMDVTQRNLLFRLQFERCLVARFPAFAGRRKWGTANRSFRSRPSPLHLHSAAVEHFEVVQSSNSSTFACTGKGYAHPRCLRTSTAVGRLA